MGDDWVWRTVLSLIGESGEDARMGDEDRGDGTAGLKSHGVRSLNTTGPATENMVLVVVFLSGVLSGCMNGSWSRASRRSGVLSRL